MALLNMELGKRYRDGRGHDYTITEEITAENQDDWLDETWYPNGYRFIDDCGNPRMPNGQRFWNGTVHCMDLVAKI